MKAIRPTNTKGFIFILGIFLHFGIVNTVNAQLEFTNEDRLLFVGTDSIDSKKIVTSVYVTPIDSFNLILEIDVLENWKHKDKINTTVSLDKSSLGNSAPHLILQNDTLSAYRFTNENGFDVLIAKERFIDLNASSNENVKPYYMTIIKIFLPEENEYYVHTLPILFNK